jgi:hypothetical protein
VTNGVYTTGSYADPAWMTSLAGAKITGSVAQATAATTATTAGNSTQLGGVAAAGYQLVTTQTCGAGQFLSAIASGSAVCGSAQASLAAPLAISGNLAGPIFSATNSGAGTGSYGENSSSTGSAYAVHGKISNAASSGSSAGVRGEHLGTTGMGVWGSHAGGGWGVYGTSVGGLGVYGQATGASGLVYGVYGTTASTTSQTAGVYGTATAASGTTVGLYGVATASPSGTGVVGKGQATGAFFEATGTTTVNGLVGQSDSTLGNGDGVQGTSAGGTGAGVYGFAAGNGGNGVEGVSQGASSVGVWGISSAGRGVQGNSTTGFAGYFQGNVQVTGTLSKGGGSFKIDHPLDPANKYLYHSFVESPDMMNIYNGNITTDAKGETVVVMPVWFSALNRDFRYQLTVIGEFAQAIVGREMEDNRFVIRTSKPGVKVSWQVTGIRRDDFANAHRIPVEEEKPAAERGTYLHPVEHGQSVENGLDYENNHAHETADAASSRQKAPPAHE